MATKRFNDPIEPMTLSNMRENGGTPPTGTALYDGGFSWSVRP
jgi:hypothetical protein